MINKTPFLFLAIVGMISLAGCERIEPEPVHPENEVFNFTVTEVQRESINKSRGKSYEVTDPVPVLQYAGTPCTLDRFEIRGESSLNFERKAFSINLEDKILFQHPAEKNARKFEEFKLIALVFDYTYIEHSLAAGLFREVGLWPVYSFFTEVKLNNHSQGLYHFIEDPVEYFIEQQNAGFVLRRGYNHSIRDFNTAPRCKNDSQAYLSRFQKIYSDITRYSGQTLYDTLSSRIDLEQYFTKLAIDLLLKNGDYTDEVFFYSKTRNKKEVFGVFPWDYDDIFSDLPHEIGRSWAVGTLFGKRSYSSMSAVVADVGSKLLYSVEDDLDYKIAKDNLLYQRYLTTLKGVIDQLSPSVIDQVFDHTTSQITPFYANDSILLLSKFDAERTSYDLYVSNLAKKRQFIKDRRNWILQELKAQQKGI